MANFNDGFDNGSPGDVFDHFAHLFQHFNFPSGPRKASSLIERDYRSAVARLHALDSFQLIGIAQECLDEWNLKLDMGQNKERDGVYLQDFVTRLNVAIDQINNSLVDDFSAWQEVPSQFEDSGTFCADSS
jgi:hypothetical protein